MANPFVKHIIVTLFSAGGLSACAWAVFCHLEADKEIAAICGYLDGATPGEAAASFPTLSYSSVSEAGRTDGEAGTLHASWGFGLIQGKRCLMSRVETDAGPRLTTQLH